MSALARPAVLAWLLSLAALALHPALHAERWLPGRELVLVAVLLLALVGLVARALAARGGARTAAWLVAAGAALVLAGVGLDGLRGRHGTVTLGLGQTSRQLRRGWSRRPLARPAAASASRIGADAKTAAGVSLLLPHGTVELTGRRAIAVGGFRLADPRVTATGGVARLRVAASDGTRTDVAELTPDGPARAGDLVLSLEQYFPDFALDEKQQPFTRSLEPRNPAALLSVARGDQVHRAFVLQSMPGVHRVEPLGLAFSLLDVEPERAVTIGVHRQPFALAVLLGGLRPDRRSRARRPLARRQAASEPSNAGPLVAGAGLLACLLLVDSGRVLAWSLGLAGPGGRVPLPGVGILLGLALLAALAGVLLLAAQRLARRRRRRGTVARGCARGRGASPPPRASALALVRVSSARRRASRRRCPSPASRCAALVAGGGAAAAVREAARRSSSRSRPACWSRSRSGSASGRRRRTAAMRRRRLPPPRPRSLLGLAACEATGFAGTAEAGAAGRGPGAARPAVLRRTAGQAVARERLSGRARDDRRAAGADRPRGSVCCVRSIRYGTR